MQWSADRNASFSQVERLFRDVQTSTLVPPNVDKAMEIVGKAGLAEHLPISPDAP